MLKIFPLQLYLLTWCQAAEILTDLGENVTINCDLDLNEVTWLIINSTHPPILILRSFSNPAATFYFNERFRQKYSVQPKHNLFINNASIHELGDYYCTKIDRTAKFSNRSRLVQTPWITPITVPTQPSESQNHTVVVQPTEPTLWQMVTVILALMSVVLVFGFIASFGFFMFFAGRSNKHPQR